MRLRIITWHLKFFWELTVSHGLAIPVLTQHAFPVQVLDEVEVRPHVLARQAVIVEDVPSYMLHADLEIGERFLGVLSIKGDEIAKPTHEFLGKVVP